MLETFDTDAIWSALPYLFKEGLTFTLLLTALATAGGILLGTVLALARMSRFVWLSRVAALYVDLMRSLPLVLVIFWFYFLLPFIVQWVVRSEQPVPIGAFGSALVTFILFESAYFCEIVRAGIGMIPRGQAAAGTALGMTSFQVNLYIVLPQVFRNMLPVFLTQTIVLFQDTSLVYVLSLPDFLGAASKIAQRDGRLVEMYLFAAVVYFALSYGMSRCVKAIQARVAIIR